MHMKKTPLLRFHKATPDSGQSVLKSSKPSFGCHTQQAVAATTTFCSTSSLYYMCHGSQCHSNLVTNPSSCVLLTLQSVLNQNWTCQSTSSCCRILMIFDTLKIELKPFFTADITEDFLLYAHKNGEHFCEEKLHNGNENGEHICGENCMEIISIFSSSTSLVVVIKTNMRLHILSFLRFASNLLGLNINPPRSMDPLQENTSSITMLNKLLSTHPCLMVTTITT